MDASNLKAGYQLLSENGKWQVVQSIRQTNEPLSAYNLTVNNDHTCFVTGSNSTYGVWVHNSCNPSGWISRKVWNQLSPNLQQKFNNAISKGIVAPTANQGVIKLPGTDALASQGYTHKLKILGQGGDIRIYGKQQPNGHIIYDKIVRH